MLTSNTYGHVLEQRQRQVAQASMRHRVDKGARYVVKAITADAPVRPI